ncbi:PLK5 kinase, partial [Pomatostomus ruficeps]|nr:PLK5 kinase [Pomatostomus ruficeps]
YAALSGHPPFEACHRPELFRSIGDPLSPRLSPQLSPRLSPPARALIAQMLHPEPAARPSLAAVRGHPFLTQVTQGT